MSYAPVIGRDDARRRKKIGQSLITEQPATRVGVAFNGCWKCERVDGVFGFRPVAGVLRGSQFAGLLKDRTALGGFVVHANEGRPERLIDQRLGPGAASICAISGERRPVCSCARRSAATARLISTSTATPTESPAKPTRRGSAPTAEARARQTPAAFEAASTTHMEALDLRGRTLLRSSWSRSIATRSSDSTTARRHADGPNRRRPWCSAAMMDLVGELEARAQHPREALDDNHPGAGPPAGRPKHSAPTSRRATLLLEAGLEPVRAGSGSSAASSTMMLGPRHWQALVHRNGHRNDSGCSAALQADAFAMVSMSFCCCWGSGRSPRRRDLGCRGHAGKFDGEADRGADAAPPSSQ